MSPGFQTLEQFSRLVRASQVSLGEGGVLSLEDGMERALQTFELIKARGRKILLIGNGGSAAVASHQAVDLWRNAGVRALAFSDASMLTCIANDFGYGQVFAQPIEMLCDSGDCLIAISSSGKSQNILQAVDKARAKGLLRLLAGERAALTRRLEFLPPLDLLRDRRGRAPPAFTLDYRRICPENQKTKP